MRTDGTTFTAKQEHMQQWNMQHSSMWATEDYNTPKLTVVITHPVFSELCNWSGYGPGAAADTATWEKHNACTPARPALRLPSSHSPSTREWQKGERCGTRYQSLRDVQTSTSSWHTRGIHRRPSLVCDSLAERSHGDTAKMSSRRS